MSSCTKGSNLSQNNFGYSNHYQDTNQMPNPKLNVTVYSSRILRKSKLVKYTTL